MNSKIVCYFILPTFLNNCFLFTKIAEMRIDQLTFTRFLAAFSIIVYHFGKNIFPFSNPAIAFMFIQANTGVSYFFILSGFVMIIAYGNGNPVNFFEYLRNRFARIYPVYLIALLVMLSYKFFMGFTLDITGIWLSLFSVQAWIPGEALTLNTPGWSLSVEFFFYLSFPFLLNNLYNRFRYQQIIILVLFVWVITQIFLHWFVSSKFYHGFPSSSHEFIYYFPLMHLNEFLLGNMAGLLFINKLMDKKRNYKWGILLIIAAIVILFKYPMGLIFHDGMLSFLLIPLILLISLNQGFVTDFFSKKSFVFLGEISYGIYILQLPVFKWINFLFTKYHIANPLIIFYGFVIILLLLSAISFWCIETPLRKIIKKISFSRFRLSADIQR